MTDDMKGKDYVHVPDPDDSDLPFRGRGWVEGKKLFLTVEFEFKEAAESALLKYLAGDD